MPRHVVVDGSNLATEGRTTPSLKQLEDAVMAYMAENPDDVITVVVDATFGHRIDPREVPEFDAAIENNEVVCPPAGAVGRGDAFVLSIANKAGATILSNDSFQEFHGQYGWLFDEGRLVGGKPVPNIGWVFVPRTPVRGPVSRRAMKDAKRGRQPEKKTVPMRASKEASQPMPVPKAPPPGPVRVRGAAAAAAAAAGTSAAGVTGNGATAAAAGGSDARPAGKVPGKHDPINELLPFLDFVERHPVGSTVEATVDAFSSHGAYVLAGEARCYVPLRHLGDPAPRSAREVLSLGEQRTFVVVSFNAQRRGIDVADPAFASAVAPADGVPVAVGALGEVARGAAAAGDAAAGGGGAAGGGSGRGRRRRGRGRSGDRTAEGAAVTEAVVAGDGDVIVTSGAPAAAGVGDEPATAPRRTSRKRAVKAEGVVSEVEEPVVTAAPPRRRAAASRAAAEPAAVQPAVEPAAGAAATPKGPRRNTAAAPTKPATKKAVAPAAAPSASAAKAAAKKAVAEPPAQAAPAKATARKASARKASAGQAPAGQVTAEQVPAKKVAAKKAAAKKAVADKAVADKAVADKAVADKAPAKKAAAKKAAAKKAGATTAAATSAATTGSSAKAATAATAAAVPPAPAKKAAARKAATKTSAPGS